MRIPTARVKSELEEKWSEAELMDVVRSLHGPKRKSKNKKPGEKSLNKSKLSTFSNG